MAAAMANSATGHSSSSDKDGLATIKKEIHEQAKKKKEEKHAHDDDDHAPKLTPEQERLQKFGFDDAEFMEVVRRNKKHTGYPASARTYRIHYEAYNTAIEEPYFWYLHYIRYFGGFADLVKITDVFAASENSAFFGASQQRLGLQQDKVSQYLATIGKMVRELFQLVRELRILDERLSYYADSYTKSKSSESAEITLKGVWVDMVEQGAKNPASVYGMAREVLFTTLPDLFFSTHPKSQEDVDEVVEKQRGQFNRKVKEVLKRKLRAYLAWKDHSYDELKNRRVFTLKYLRQHYEIINMYVSWVKPYLKNIQRLQLNQKRNDTPDLIVAFESSMIEIEILAKKKGTGEFNQVILTHFLYRTRPDMNYSQEYNRGPIHIGRVEMTFRAYAWTDEQIKKYQDMKKQEDLELLGMIDGSVKAALEALGEELLRYLREAGEEIGPKKEEKEEEEFEQETILDPFALAYKGLEEIFYSFKRSIRRREDHAPKRIELYQKLKRRKDTEGKVTKMLWDIYHHYKKQHSMLNW